MKRFLSVFTSVLLSISLIACSGADTSSSSQDSSNTQQESSAASSDSSLLTQTDYSNQTLGGQVTEISDYSVTLQLGGMNQGMNPGTPPDKPDGDASGMPSEPPTDMPSDASGAPSDPPTGDPSNKPSDPPTDMPSDASDMPAGDPMDMETETVTLDLSDAVITVQNGDTTTEGSIADIVLGSYITVTIDNNNTAALVVVGTMNPGTPPSGGNFGGSAEFTQGNTANLIDTDGTYSGESYSSIGDDENALRIDGVEVSLTDITVDKTSGSSSNTESGDFYGVNAALLSTNGAQITISNANVSSSAQNGNGVFSYGEGTVVNISDSVITTTADNSGGIQTTGGGTTHASNLTVTTSGSSSAAIRSDRGGGTVTVDGGSYTSNGYNSPAVYSTADITVENAELTANHSEALVIEGKNSITLKDCVVSGNMSDDKGTSSDENVHNVMIYQSMSGDADVGTSMFSMAGGQLISNNGDMLYITNTHCILTLDNVLLNNLDEDGTLMTITGNSASHGWGTAGSNGASAEVTVSNQTLEGNIIVDTISSLNLTLSENSTFTGTINIVENQAGGTAVSDNACVTIEAGSTWALTGNCTITSLDNYGTIEFNGYTITLADGTVLS